MIERKEDRPLGELFSELMNEIRTLLKQEVTLLRTEMSEKAIRFGKDAAALGAGAVVLHTAFLTIVATLVLALGNFVPMWLSALLISILLVVGGVVLIQKGRKDLTQMKAVPERSTETVKETVKWAKSQVKTTR
ncbi:phage holin family protein [Geomonas sp. RF6]|uniref:phage holin family protein n=1 Tax=Geomonas sp. RF6 TaxID=2897342 RepID=UPI001E4B44B6|nr:phage holin family protein [Geomonas sp. RF6]UFS69182.1 phage holin family protein [Geomonas sp. RF6]